MGATPLKYVRGTPFQIEKISAGIESGNGRCKVIKIS